MNAFSKLSAMDRHRLVEELNTAGCQLIHLAQTSNFGEAIDGFHAEYCYELGSGLFAYAEFVLLEESEYVNHIRAVLEHAYRGIDEVSQL